MLFLHPYTDCRSNHRNSEKDPAQIPCSTVVAKHGQEPQHEQKSTVPGHTNSCLLVFSQLFLFFCAYPCDRLYVFNSLSDHKEKSKHYHWQNKNQHGSPNTSGTPDARKNLKVLQGSIVSFSTSKVKIIGRLATVHGV